MTFQNVITKIKRLDPLGTTNNNLRFYKNLANVFRMPCRAPASGQKVKKLPETSGFSFVQSFLLIGQKSSLNLFVLNCWCVGLLA